MRERSRGVRSGRGVVTALKPNNKKMPRIFGSPAFLFKPHVLAGARVLHHATPYLIEFNRFEQRLEVAFAETLIALALDDLEEDRANLVFREDLQQDFVAHAIDQDFAFAQFRHRFAVIRHAPVDEFVIRVDSVQQRDFGATQIVDGAADIVAAQRNVLDAFAMIGVEILLDLPRRIRAFLVDRDADLAARRAHRFRLDRGHLAFNIEVTRLAEIEQTLVELGPFDHPSAMNVVRQMVDVRQSVTDRILLGAGNGLEIDVIDADVADAALLRAILAAPAVHEVNQRIADSLDRGNIQFHRAGFIVEAPSAEIERAFVGLACIGDPEGDRADRRAVQTRKAL